MTKEEKIKEAWGINYGKPENSFNNDGWLTWTYNSIASLVDVGELEEHPDHFWYRPISLRGIETNNGWIKIESEKDLPKNDGQYWVKQILSGKITTMDISQDNPYGENFMKNHCSHYQPIQKPEPPLY